VGGGGKAIWPYKWWLYKWWPYKCEIFKMAAVKKNVENFQNGRREKKVEKT
jgi:hypothetical protein